MIGGGIMWSIKDKLLLLFGGCLILFMRPITVYSVVVPLVGVTLSALNGVYTDHRFSCAVGTAYSLLCFARPEFSVFLPLIFYDVFLCRFYLFYGVALIPLVTAEHAFTGDAARTGMISLMQIVSFLLCSHSKKIETLRLELMRQRDNGREAALLLESRNKELMEKQDVEIRLATLAERNRIAREIHDNVGHMLSRSILQVGALMAVNREPVTAEGLKGLHGTLSDAMDSIRKSVHDLHDESINLYAQIGNLIKEFTFCPVRLEYDAEGAMGRGLKYTLLSIIREALSNIARHSSATQATITLREHPALYQLIIQDNGGGAANTGGRGIGLQNMYDRVAAYNGNLNIDGKNGFKIFISIPKGERTA